MNYTLIFLGVIIAILLYVLYYYNSSTSAVLSSKANLNATVPPITSINNPTNTRYAYGIWVYVNSWNSTTEKVIFSRNNNIRLRLDNTKPTLYCEVTMNDGSTIHRTTITDNFPLQKWVFIIVSVDNQFLDCYLDGKLVKSTRLYQYKGAPHSGGKWHGHEGFIEGKQNMWTRGSDGTSHGTPQPGPPSGPASSGSPSSRTPSSGSPSSGSPSSGSPSSGSRSPSGTPSVSPSPSGTPSGTTAPSGGNKILIPAIPPTETTPIVLGGTKPFDAVVATFTRWNAPVDPQTAWTAYTGGNTTSGLGKLGNIASYGANLSILQNNAEYSKITLF
jgi:hypothetical protein